MSGNAAFKFGKVAVLYGGRSAEREVSLKSGAAVLAGLKARGVDAHGIDPGPDIARVLMEGGFDRVFIVLHGRGGEDGVIQGALEVLGLPYTGSDVLGSALGMDKLRCKRLWHGQGLPTAPYAALTCEADIAAVADTVGYPVMVKPAREGSSIGMARADDEEALRAAWREASVHDGLVLAEAWITGAEYTASILGNDALPLIGLKTPNGFYDYDAKYLADTTTYTCPCGLPEEQELALRALALRAFEAVGASGWGRVDIMISEDGRPWLLEVNTVPGMTDHSLVPMSAKVAGLSFQDLVWKILEQTLETHHGEGAS